MGIIFSVNMINNCNKYFQYEMKNFYAIVEIPIRKNNVNNL